MINITDSQLLEAIDKLKSQNSLNDLKFARKVGVDPATWNRIKNGAIRPSMNFISGLLRAFPELYFDILKYLNERGDGD